MHARGRLSVLITEAWVRPKSFWSWLPRQSWLERNHPGLAGACIRSWNLRSLLFEILARARRRSDWDTILARNTWFQRQAVRELRAWSREQSGGSWEGGSPKSEVSAGGIEPLAHPTDEPATDNRRPILFSYSYAALELFRFAKNRGWKTVLGQIDPGPKHEEIASRLPAQFPEFGCLHTPPPQEYWETWREEVQLADIILVNSGWSKECLTEAGVSAGNIRVVPLAYEPSPEAARFKRSYPNSFNSARPLRVLTLGQVNLTKGTGLVLEAMSLLEGEPVELWIVGRGELPARRGAVSVKSGCFSDIPASNSELPTPRPNVRWFGAVPRNEVGRFYRDADVFVFPTFSDGFGLTQLEAMAWRLPVITTPRCGEVVQSGVNGVKLSGPSSQELIDVLRAFVRAPDALTRYSQNCSHLHEFSLKELGQRLTSIQ